MSCLQNRPLAVLLAVSLLATGTAWAGDLVTVKTLTFGSGGPTGGVFWLSIPYAYTPPDTNTSGTVDAEDLVQDLQPPALGRPCTASSCAVVRVWTWDPATSTYASWAAGASGTPFPIIPGRAYGIEVQNVGGQTSHDLTLVGAHDATVEHNECHEPAGGNMHWIALPPHLAIDTGLGLPGVLDAEDLGQALGGRAHIYQVRRLDEITGFYDNWVVGSEYGTPFEITLTRGYAIDLSCDDLVAPCSACRWTWTPATN